MIGQSKVTTDHDEIKNWVEERGGKPAVVKSTHHAGETGIIRIDFPDFTGEESLMEISWDEFFAKFDDSQLAFVYQDSTSQGEKSRFNKIVSRESIK
jgi:hypothetical protein